MRLDPAETNEYTQHLRNALTLIGRPDILKLSVTSRLFDQLTDAAGVQSISLEYIVDWIVITAENDNLSESEFAEIAEAVPDREHSGFVMKYHSRMTEIRDRNNRNRTFVASRERIDTPSPDEPDEPEGPGEPHAVVEEGNHPGEPHAIPNADDEKPDDER